MENKAIILEIKSNVGTINFDSENLKSQIKEYVKPFESQIEYTSNPNYVITSQDLAIGRDVRATLNSKLTAMESERKRIKKEYLQPYQEFESKIKDCEVVISEVISKIDTVKNKSDEQWLENRKQQIQDFWESLEFNKVTLEKIYNSKWEQKGTTYESICDEITNKLSNISSTIDYVKALVKDDNPDYWISQYLSTLDLDTVTKGYIAWQQNKLAQEKAKEVKQEPIVKSNPAQVEDNKKYTVTLKFVGNKSQLIQLKKAIVEIGLDYKKC